MSTDLKDMPDDELTARWELHSALSEAGYRRLREIAAEEADYNRRRYLELARTPEGKAEYHAQIASFRAAEVTPRQAFYDASNVCKEYAAEWERRGNELHYPRIEALKRQLKGGKP
jgi:hypothetical protein